MIRASDLRRELVCPLRSSSLLSRTNPVLRVLCVPSAAAQKTLLLGSFGIPLGSCPISVQLAQTAAIPTPFNCQLFGSGLARPGTNIGAQDRSEAKVRASNGVRLNIKPARGATIIFSIIIPRRHPQPTAERSNGTAAKQTLRHTESGRGFAASPFRPHFRLVLLLQLLLASGSLAAAASARCAWKPTSGRCLGQTARTPINLMPQIALGDRLHHAAGQTQCKRVPLIAVCRRSRGHPLHRAVLVTMAVACGRRAGSSPKGRAIDRARELWRLRD